MKEKKKIGETQHWRDEKLTRTQGKVTQQSRSGREGVRHSFCPITADTAAKLSNKSASELVLPLLTGDRQAQRG